MQISSVKFEDVGGNDATLKVSACWEKALYLHKQSLFVFNLNKKLYVCAPLHAWCPQKLQGSARFPGTGVTDSLSHRVGSRKQTQVLCKSGQCF